MPTNVTPFEADDQSRRLPPLPHNELAEEAVLGTLLANPVEWDDISGEVAPADFYFEENMVIFAAIQECATAGSAIDVSAINERLEHSKKLNLAGGLIRLVELKNAGELNLTESLKSSVEQIQKSALLRRMHDTCAEIARESERVGILETNEFLEKAENKVLAVRESEQFDLTSYELESALNEVEDELRQIRIFGRTRQSLPSGYLELDHFTGGFQKSHLTILAARPGVGKTALALNIVENILINRTKIAEDDDHGPIFFFSLEQPRSELLYRLLSSLSKISVTQMKSTRLSPYEEDRLASALVTLRENTNGKLLVDEASGTNIDDMRRRVKAAQRTYGDPSLIVVDYIQIMPASLGMRREDSRERQVADISSGLKRIARDFNVPVLALSQLNRESERRQSRQPRLSDLRDSGSIEQDADVVLLLHRNAANQEDGSQGPVADDESPLSDSDTESTLYIAKNRHGERGKVEFNFVGGHMRFDPRFGESEHGAGSGRFVDARETGSNTQDPQESEFAADPGVSAEEIEDDI